MTLSGPETLGGAPVSDRCSRTEDNTAQFLASRGIGLTHPPRALFLDCLLDNYIPALSLLERRAKGDYEPDDLPALVPTISPPSAYPSRPYAVTLEFCSRRGRKPAAHLLNPTVESWRTGVQGAYHIFPDRRRLRQSRRTKPRAWGDKQGDRERPPSPFATHGSRLRTRFSLGGHRRKLTTNPFAEAVMEVPRRKKYRPKSFHGHEPATILKAAKA